MANGRSAVSTSPVSSNGPVASLAAGDAQLVAGIPDAARVVHPVAAVGEGHLGGPVLGVGRRRGVDHEGAAGILPVVEVGADEHPEGPPGGRSGLVPYMTNRPSVARMTKGSAQ